MPLQFFKRLSASTLALALTLTLISASTSVFSQGGYTRPNTSYGTRTYRTAVDSTFSFPTGCGAPSLRGYDLKMANIYYDSCGTAMYVRNPKTNTWTELAAGGSTVYVDSIYLQGDSALYYTKDGVDYLVANLKDAVTGGNDSLRTTYIDSTGIDSYFIPIAFPDGYFHADTSLRWQPTTGALLVGRNGGIVQLQVKGRITVSGGAYIGDGLTVNGMLTTTDTVNYKAVVQNTLTKEFRRLTSYPGQVLQSGNGVKIDGSTVRLADTIRQTTEIKVAYDSGANNLQINGYRDGSNNRMGIAIEPDYNRVSIGAYDPGGSSLLQLNTSGEVNIIGRPLNLYLDTMRMIQTGTSTAYAPLATDMSKYRVLLIDKTTGALVSVVKDSIGSGGAGITGIGSFSASGDAKGASISGSDLILHPATATQPGGVSIGAQTFAGEKTFDDPINTEDPTGLTSIPSIYFRNAGAASRMGIGRRGDLGTMQFFTYGSYRWYGGGDFNDAATNWMTLGSTGLNLGVDLNVNSVLRTFNAASNTAGASIYLRDFTGAGNQIGIGRGLADVHFFGINGYGFRWYGGGQFNTGASNWAYMDEAGFALYGANTASSAFTVTNTAKGTIPIPKMTRTQKVAISSPAVGLLVYDTDNKAIWANLNGSTTTWGAIYAAQDTVATDADFTMPVYSSFVILPTISSNRTVTLPVASSYENKTIIIKVANSAGFAWSVAVAIKDKTDADVTALTNDTVYTLYSDGTFWHITSIY